MRKFENDIENDLELLTSCCQGFFYKELFEQAQKRVNLYDGPRKKLYQTQLEEIKHFEEKLK